MTDQFFFILQSEIPRRRATGDDECLCFQPFIIRFNANMAVARLEIRHFGIRETSAKLLSLFVHIHDQLRAVDPVGKSRVILH